jgi:hypothetical protein
VEEKIWGMNDQIVDTTVSSKGEMEVHQYVVVLREDQLEMIRLIVRQEIASALSEAREMGGE